MPAILHANEMLKRKFCKYLEEVKGFSRGSIESYEGAIWLWQNFTENKSFFLFKADDVTRFKDWIKSKKKANQQQVSLSYCYDMLRYLRVFFGWVADQKGGRLKIKRTDIEYLRLTKKENQIVLNPKSISCPSMQEVREVIESIDSNTEVGMRDRALLSLALLTGARIKALSTLTVQCFDEKNFTLYQDPKLGVETKFSKRIVSVLLPLSYTEPLDYFIKWVRYLKEQKNFEPADPLFPATKIMPEGSNLIGYHSDGDVSNRKWNTTGPARKIFETRFNDAGKPYYNPHSFRHLLVQEIMKMPLTEEEKKAVSQNFGHEHVGTTFGSYGYGAVSEERQSELLKGLNKEKSGTDPVSSLSEKDLANLKGLLSLIEKAKQS